MTDKKEELRAIIASGEHITSEQDAMMKALLPPQEYAAISSYLLNTTVNLNNLQNNWVVYTVASADAEFYCGMCRYNQLLQFPDGYRNTEFRRMVKINTNIKLKVHAQFKKEQDAKNYQSNMCEIKTYYANQVGKPYVKLNSKRIRCLTDGNEFNTIVEAAKFYQISSTLISNVINNVPGYKYASGMKFERVIE